MSTAQLFVSEAERLTKLGRLHEALTSLENALCVRGLRPSSRVVIYAIVRDLGRKLYQQELGR